MTTMDVSSLVELYDSEFLAIEEGPLAWANHRVGSRRNIDQFCRDLTEQFGLIGLEVEVQPWTTADPEAYAFKVEIRARVTPQPTDYDRMQHEIRANILEIPGADGTIPFDMKSFLRQQGRRH